LKGEGAATAVPTVTVALCAHTARRTELTINCVTSVLGGATQPNAIVVVVDNNAPLLATLRSRVDHPLVTVVQNSGRGASAARNTALDLCQTDVVLFIDDDARADPSWLQEMAGAFADLEVVGVGGRVLPDWEAEPDRIPPELFWIVGATYRGHPEVACPISRPIGASMGVKAEAMRVVGGFPSAFGPRDGKKASSNEELALFTAIRRKYGPDCVVYVPEAIVHHHAPVDRATWKYLVSRSWSEGVSKAEARLVFGGDVMAYDGDYVRETLLPAIGNYILGGARARDGRSLRFGLMCASALGVTATGYTWRLARSRLQAPGRHE
jgi:GT2 family glycosyltransferase